MHTTDEPAELPVLSHKPLAFRWWRDRRDVIVFSVMYQPARCRAEYDWSLRDVLAMPERWVPCEVPRA